MGGFVSKHWGTAATVAFLAYMGNSMFQLYRVAMPSIPPIVDPETGTVKPHLAPLWAEASSGLDFKLVVSTSSVWKIDVPEVTVLHLGADSIFAQAANITYDFGSAATVELDMGFTVLREGGGSADVVSLPCAADDLDATSDATCDSVSIGLPTGLHIWCKPSSSSGGAPDLCTRLHSIVAKVAGPEPPSGNGAHGPRPVDHASGYQWLKYHLGLDAGIQRLPLATYSLRDPARSWSALSPSPSSQSLAAVVNAISTGAPLFAHVTVSVATGDPASAAATVPVPARKGKTKTSINRAKLRQPSPTLLHASTALVIPREYKPVTPVRLLWKDPTGERALAASKRRQVFASLPVEPSSRTLLVPIQQRGQRSATVTVGGPAEMANQRNGGYNRVFLPTTTCTGDACAIAPATLALEAASNASASGDRHVSSSTNKVVTETHYLPTPKQAWPHWVGHLDVRLLMETVPIPRDDAPPALRPYLHIVPVDTKMPVAPSTGSLSKGDGSGTSAAVVGKYVPLLAVNPIRPLQEAYHALNHTVTDLPLRLSLSPSSIGHWQLLQVLDASLNTQQALGASERDTDDVIRLFADTPAWLLLITLLVSTVHVTFDVLAIKNDVAFWSSTKSLRGISVRSLSIQLVSNTIIAVYLWHEGASLLVLLPQAALTLLLAWKIAKASGFVLHTKWIVPYVLPVPVPRYDAALAASASEARTSEYDRQALHFVLTLLAPLVAGFVAHSFLYVKHSSWAEWALGTAVGAVYAFGFALMTPQLWINYKLKSVAQLPWRVLAYRFFNTVIDDLFASIIRMPLMHRLSVFRDDVIFVIYMGQRWMYPIDRERPAESYEEDGSNTTGVGVGSDATAAPATGVGVGSDTGSAGGSASGSSVTGAGAAGIVATGAEGRAAKAGDVGAPASSPSSSSTDASTTGKREGDQA